MVGRCSRPWSPTAKGRASPPDALGRPVELHTAEDLQPLLPRPGHLQRPLALCGLTTRSGYCTWREAATKAIDFSKGKQRHDLDDDELLRLALTKLVEIVGEAAKSISPESRSAMPQVPWRAAARMRDRLVHHYFDINLNILWQTITEDLPQLLAALPSEDQADPPEAR